MTRLKTSSAKWLAALGIALAFVGLLDATYLTVNHLTGKVPPCVVTQGCELVLNSEFASIAGVPMAMLGGVYFLIMMGILVAYLDRGKESLLQLAAICSAGGTAMSLWLVGVQVFELHAYCTYCLLSAALCFALLPTCLLAARAARPAAV